MHWNSRPCLPTCLVRSAKAKWHFYTLKVVDLSRYLYGNCSWLCLDVNLSILGKVQHMAETNRLTGEILEVTQHAARSTSTKIQTNTPSQILPSLFQFVKKTEWEADKNSTGSSAACSTSHSAACSTGHSTACSTGHSTACSTGLPGGLSRCPGPICRQSGMQIETEQAVGQHAVRGYLQADLAIPI